MPSRYISPLRDLARVINETARQHKTYSQVVGLFQHVNEYLSLRAYMEEVHNMASEITKTPKPQAQAHKLEEEKENERKRIMCSASA